MSDTRDMANFQTGSIYAWRAIMDVTLPNTGCNILISESSFYNYSPDSRTRERYYIYEGKAYRQSTDYSQYGYTYTGTCLNTGDLVYKPELKVYFEIISIVIFYLIVRLVFRLLRGKGL